MCIVCRCKPAHKARHCNRTSFKPGPNPHRHRFTTAERQRGFQALMDALYSWSAIDRPAAYAAAWRKVRAHLKHKNQFAAV